MTSQQSWYWALNYFNKPFVQSVQLQNSFLKFAFPSIWRMPSKYSTKQHTSAQLSCKQMSKIFYRNICTFLRYHDFCVGVFYFGSPCVEEAKTGLGINVWYCFLLILITCQEQNSNHCCCCFYLKWNWLLLTEINEYKMCISGPNSQHILVHFCLRTRFSGAKCEYQRLVVRIEYVVVTACSNRCFWHSTVFVVVDLLLWLDLILLLMLAVFVVEGSSVVFSGTSV